MGREKGRKNISWPPVIEEVKNIIAYFATEDIKPTLRALFYRLVSKGILPNTGSYYGSLSRNLVEARQNGTIPFDALTDGNRYNIDNFGDACLQTGDIEYAKSGYQQKLKTLNLGNIVSEYFNYEYLQLKAPTNSFWAEQPIIPEIWIEKDAIAAIIAKWTADLHVTIRIMKGYDSWTHLYTSIENVKDVLESHDKVCILYLGDLDPSGVDMDRHIKEAIDHFGMSDYIDVRRIALVEKQVDQYGLPPRMTVKVGDTRAKKYSSDYNTEVDAFLSMAPNAFKALIRSTVQKFHNMDISKVVAEKNSDIVNECRVMRLDAIEKAKQMLVEQIRRTEK